jgi:hypothetical protein
MPKKRFYSTHTDYCSEHPQGSYAVHAWDDVDADGDCEFVPAINNYAGCGDCLALAGFAPIYNCSNAFLRPGQFTKPHATYMSGSHPNIGDACYLFQPRTIIANIIQTLDGECKSLFGNATVCYDTAGNVINCTAPPALPSKYWKTYPCRWVEDVSFADIWGGHFGACLQLVEYSGGAGQYWLWKGCPTGTIDEQLSGWYAATHLGFGAVQYPQSGQYYDGSVGSRINGRNAFTGGDGTGNTYTPGTLITGISNYNPSNANGSDGVTAAPTKYGCFEAFRTGSCPEFMSTDPTESRRCIVEERAAICPSGYTLHTTDYNPTGPHIPFTTPPYCVREHDSYLPIPRKTHYARGHAGQLFGVGTAVIALQENLTVARYGDAIPEVPVTYSMTYEGTGVNVLGFGSPNVHVRGSGQLDVFFLRQRDISGTPTWEVCQVHSDNTGYGFIPRVVGPFDPAANLKVTGVDYLGNSETYYVTVRTVCGGDYSQLRTVYSRSGQLIVFGFRGGKWYVRSCEQKPDNTWEASAEVEVADTDDNTCEDGRETGEGVFSFLCCNDAGMLQIIRADEGVAKDGSSSWVPEDLIDAFTEEYFSYSVNLESNGQRAVIVAWKPAMLGRVWDGPTHQGGWNSLGNIVVRIADKEDDGSWTLQAEKVAFGGGALVGPMYMTLYRRRDGQYQIHGPGNRIAALDAEGNGSWVVS